VPHPHDHRRASSRPSAIAGMDRMIQHNVIAMSGRAVERRANVDTLLLDKTGTITLGNRQAAAFVPAEGVSVEALADAAQLASLADETPEGGASWSSPRRRTACASGTSRASAPRSSPSAPRHGSVVWIWTGRRVRKGAADADRGVRGRAGGHRARRRSAPPPTRSLARAGRRWWVADGSRALGVIHLKDIVKGGIRERFAELRRMGSRR